MTEKTNWTLQPGIEMSSKVADDVAKVSCALKSLSAFTTFVIEREDCPEDLKQIVDDGLEAMSRLYVW
jgi:hypothetical protein